MKNQFTISKAKVDEQLKIQEYHRILRTKLKDLSNMHKYEEDNGQIGIIKPHEIMLVLLLGQLLPFTLICIAATQADAIDRFIVTLLNKLLL